MSKRIVAFILMLVMMVSCVPISVFAAENTESSSSPATAFLYAESTYCLAGEEVEVDICIAENPGIAGAKFSVTFDERLTLIKAVEEGGAFEALDYTAPGTLGNNCPFNWDSLDAISTEEGTVITLTFKVAEDVTAGEKLDIDITYKYGAIYDVDLNSIAVTTVGGILDAIDYMPGDADGDKAVNGKDVTLIRRYNADWDVEIDLRAADANGDGEINGKDVNWLRRYNAEWEGYEPLPTPVKCVHQFSSVAEKAPTCTESGNIAYWYCSKCEKYFSDENGTTEIDLEDTVIEASHRLTAVEAKSPSYTEEGNIAYWYCSACEKYFKDAVAGEEITYEDTVLPKLQATEHLVKYEIANGDPYIQKLLDNGMLVNPNQERYAEGTGLPLDDLSVAGYRFLGWYDLAVGGTLVKKIDATATDDYQLYAHWDKVVYKVTFDSPEVDVEYTWYDKEQGANITYTNEARYTVDTGLTLKNPDRGSEGEDLIRGYTFVGWSIDGKIVSEIPVGFADHVEVHANWTSDRNRAEAKALASPDIIEDMENGRYYFVYEIGTIFNVPLAQLKYHGNPDTITMTQGQSYTTTIDETLVNKLTNTISNATTTTSSWTLSEEWNQSASATNETDEQIGKTEGRVDSEGNVTGEKYYISNVSGGSTSVSTNSGGSSSSSSKITTGVSTGLTDSYHDESEVNKSVDVNVKAGIGVGYGPFKAEVSAEMGANVSTHDKSTHDLVETRNTNVGTYRENNSNSYWDTNNSSSSSWNTTNSYESSSEASQSTELSKVISEIISNRYGYTSTDSHTENNSSTITKGGEETLTDEYEVTVEYSLETKTVSYEEETRTYNNPGHYQCRTILAGTAHVFAVVGYDISTSSYFTTTYTVLDKDTQIALDFSAKSAEFNDGENAIIPFEVPYYVHEYVSSIIARSGGLVVDPTTGYITEYDDPYKNIAVGPDHEQNIVIPEYISVDNGDNTYSAVRVRGIAPTAFKGSKITGIYLPKYISEIPDGAFEGCANLNTVIGYGITDIGNNAFKGCENLTTFVIDEYITSLGENAFEGCSEISATAVNASVAEAVLNSGAKKITLDLTKLSDSFDNHEVVIADSTEYFALFGGGKTFTNLQIESNATETFISNITFVGNIDTPIKLSSDTITLGRVTVENAPGFALVIDSDSAEVKLLGDIKLSSKSENAVISKDVVFSRLDSGVAGYMKVTGKYLICGTVTNEGMLQASGGIHSIDEDTFNSMLTSSIVAFDANGGSVAEESKTVYYGQYYGSLPDPIRENYTFTGWYTEAEGGTQITEDSIVSALVNQTLYAHWTPNEFTVYFDANGGSVSISSQTLTYGNALGTLPTPIRDYYTFTGWYDADGNPVYDSTVPSSATNFTIYAQWEAKGIVYWAKASDAPADAQVLDRKYTYTQTYYTTSSSSYLDGWTHYNTTSAWSDYGAWSDWQDSEVSESDSRQVEAQQVVASTNYKTVYHYFYYSKAETGYETSFYATNTYGKNRYTVDLDAPLTKTGTTYSHNGYTMVQYKMWHTNNTKYRYVYACYGDDPYTTQEVVSYNYKVQYRYRDRSLIYTYYFYRTEDLEATSYPSESDISNVQEWVCYRPR